MSACLAALVVLGILGIFSARYRSWAKEALDCVARRVTLRPCRTGFNEKVKAKITSKLMGKSRRLARFAHKRFELISWIFTVLLFASMIYSGYSMYNMAVYGTCDPSNPDQCVFSPELPTCGNPSCTGDDHCFCDGKEVRCNEQVFIQCAGDCDCVCKRAG